VFTLHSRCDSSGSDDLAASLLERQPDLVVLQGTSAALQEHLGESGLLDVYPYREYFVMYDRARCGTVVYSKSPLVKTASSTPEQPVVRVRLDGSEVVLVPADVPGPQDGVAAWNAAIGRLGRVAVPATSEG